MLSAHLCSILRFCCTPDRTRCGHSAHGELGGVRGTLERGGGVGTAHDLGQRRGHGVTALVVVDARVDRGHLGAEGDDVGVDGGRRKTRRAPCRRPTCRRAASWRFDFNNYS